MEKILIVGAGTFQLPIVQRASLDYEVLLAAPAIDDRFRKYISGSLIADVRDKEAVLDFAIKNKVSGVITDQTDIAVCTVAYVAEKMGLPGIGYETGRLFTNKALMRKRLIELGIGILPYREVSSAEEAAEFFRECGSSVILKPLDTQGSRGVSRCTTCEDIEEKFAEAAKWSGSGRVIVEKCAEGREFVVEGMAADYEFRNLICGDTEYFDIPDAFAAKRRIFPTSADKELSEKVCELNSRIIRGFGLKQGITHSEFIMDGDDIYLIETAARGGGVFISSDLISLATGLETEKFLLDMATGKRNSLPETGQDLQACGYMAFYVPDGVITAVRGLEEVRALDYVHRNQLDELYAGRVISGGQKDKTTRLAVTVSADTRDELLERMDHIRDTLEVDCENGQGVNGLIWE
ncbi:MAG: ATP-grasp domain-containing protein [Eubacterium sp.]|nr:ATP-grasp domain-containing protein [Eubacterium sp.]